MEFGQLKVCNILFMDRQREAVLQHLWSRSSNLDLSQSGLYRDRTSNKIGDNLDVVNFTFNWNPSGCVKTRNVMTRDIYYRTRVRKWRCKHGVLPCVTEFTAGRCQELTATRMAPSRYRRNDGRTCWSHATALNHHHSDAWTSRTFHVRK